jgi:hypothetical protein
VRKRFGGALFQLDVDLKAHYSALNAKLDFRRPTDAQLRIPVEFRAPSFLPEVLDAIGVFAVSVIVFFAVQRMLPASLPLALPMMQTEMTLVISVGALIALCTGLRVYRDLRL